MKKETKDLFIFALASVAIAYWIASIIGLARCHAACGTNESLLSCQIDSMLYPGTPTVAVCVDATNPNVEIRAVKMSK